MFSLAIIQENCTLPYRIHHITAVECVRYVGLICSFFPWGMAPFCTRLSKSSAREFRGGSIKARSRII